MVKKVVKKFGLPFDFGLKLIFDAPGKKLSYTSLIGGHDRKAFIDSPLASSGQITLFDCEFDKRIMRELGSEGFEPKVWAMLSKKA